MTEQQSKIFATYGGFIGGIALTIFVINLITGNVLGVVFAVLTALSAVFILARTL